MRDEERLEAMNLGHTDLRDLLRRHFGREEFEPGQEEVIASLLSERDVLVAGIPDRSLCYKLPALILGGVTLVVSRASQMVEREDFPLLPTTHINNFLSATHLEERIRNMAQDQYKLVYAGPEQFRNRSFLIAATKKPVVLLVVDDAHCISHWNHDFRPDYLDINRAVMEMDFQPIMLALASPCTRLTQNEIRYQLQMYDAKIVTPDLIEPVLSIEVKSVFSPEEKYRILASLIPKLDGQGIIYTNSRQQTVEIYDFLKEYKARSAIYHGGLESGKRFEVERAFSESQIQTVIVTTASSFPAVPHTPSGIGYVIHFDMPDRLERYYEQIALAGAYGAPARAILMYYPADRSFHQNIIERNAVTLAEIWRIRDVLSRYSDDDLLVLPYGQMELEAAVDRYKIRHVLREMEEAGTLEILPDCSINAKVRILVSRDELASYAEDSAVQSLTEWLINSSLDPSGEIHVDFAQLKAELSRRHDDLENRLLALNHSGAISYRSLRKGMALHLLDLEASPPDDVFEKLKSYKYDALRSVEEYVHTDECRQRFLCEYLDYEVDYDCGKCDNCARAVSREHAIDKGGVHLPHHARLVMELVNKSEGRLGKDTIVKILTGLKQQTTRFDKWAEFGALDMFAPDDVQKIIDLLIGHGFLKEEGEIRPPVDLTTKGFRALSGEMEPGDEDSIASFAEDMARVVVQKKEESTLESETDRALMAILRCAEKTDGQLGRLGMQKILRGERSKKLAKYQFDHLEEYGSLKDMTKETVLKHIDKMIERGCLAVNYLFFPMLRLTELGQKRLDKIDRKGESDEDLHDDGSGRGRGSNRI